MILDWADRPRRFWSNQTELIDFICANTLLQCTSVAGLQDHSRIVLNVPALEGFLDFFEFDRCQLYDMNESEPVGDE